VHLFFYLLEHPLLPAVVEDEANWEASAAASVVVSAWTVS
jgi:hypothetical protein